MSSSDWVVHRYRCKNCKRAWSMGGNPSPALTDPPQVALAIAALALLLISLREKPR